MNNQEIIESNVATMPMPMDRWAVAEKIIGSNLLPDYIKSAADVFILMDLAVSQGKSLFQIANDNYIIKGKIAKKSEAVIRDINASGKLEGVLKFEERFQKDDNGNITYRWVRAYGKEKATGEILYGTWVSTGMVQGEGWDSNKKWQTMPDQMFRYRAATFWNRLYNSDTCIPTIDEVEDITISEAPVQRKDNMLDTSAITGQKQIAQASAAETKQPVAQPAAQPAARQEQPTQQANLFGQQQPAAQPQSRTTRRF